MAFYFGEKAQDLLFLRNIGGDADSAAFDVGKSVELAGGGDNVSGVPGGDEDGAAARL